ncbi:MAG: sigma-70 family RNA polymerase sigma factor [Aureliella sp.]
MDSSSKPDAGPFPPKSWIAGVFAERQVALLAYTTARLNGRRDDARDVVQEAFVKLCQQSWPEIEDHATAWLYRTCRNRAIDIVRREKRMSTAKFQSDISDVPDVASPPDESTSRDEQLDHVRAQVGQLSPKQQEVLRLRLQDGLSYKQIADVTGLTVSNVGFQLHDAISRLRQVLIPTSG